MELIDDGRKTKIVVRMVTMNIELRMMMPNHTRQSKARGAWLVLEALVPWCHGLDIGWKRKALARSQLRFVRCWPGACCQVAQLARSIGGRHYPKLAFADKVAISDFAVAELSRNRSMKLEASGVAALPPFRPSPFPAFFPPAKKGPSPGTALLFQEFVHVDPLPLHCGGKTLRADSLMRLRLLYQLFSSALQRRFPRSLLRASDGEGKAACCNVDTSYTTAFVAV